MHVGFVKYLFVYHVATGGECAGDGGQKPLGGCGRLAFHGWSARNGAGLEPSLFHHAEIACCMVCPPTAIWFHIPVVGRGMARSRLPRSCPGAAASPDFHSSRCWRWWTVNCCRCRGSEHARELGADDRLLTSVYTRGCKGPARQAADLRKQIQGS